MESLLQTIVAAISQSPLQETVIGLLRNVPGLPPIVQTFHILAIAVVVAAFVIPQMKVLGIAAPGQHYAEMIDRLRPWAWSALLTLLLSGAVFVLARPDRYFFNPVFGIKFACLTGALTLSLIVQRLARDSAPPFNALQRWMAALAILGWFCVIFAGRWIAYVDYLFWEV